MPNKLLSAMVLTLFFSLFALAFAPLPAGAQAAARVLVVLIYDQHCKAWCTKVRPIMKELADELGDSVSVVEIDSTAEDGKSGIKAAGDLGIIRYYKDVDMVPVVMIFDGKKKLLHEMSGPKTKETYKAAIQSSLSGK